MTVRQRSKHELVAAVQSRYARGGRTEKGQILDEFVAATGYHRKWAIGLLRHGPPPARRGQGGRPRRYSAVVVGTLRQVWEASGQLCGKRLAPFLPEFVPALEAEGALVLESAVREPLLRMSAATIGESPLVRYKVILIASTCGSCAAFSMNSTIGSKLS